MGISSVGAHRDWLSVPKFMVISIMLFVWQYCIVSLASCMDGVMCW